jgi:hypothetical protein
VLARWLCAACRVGPLACVLRGVVSYCARAQPLPVLVAFVCGGSLPRTVSPLLTEGAEPLHEGTNELTTASAYK